MKEQGHENWEYSSDEITEQATNETGFTALPGGIRGWGEEYKDINKHAYYASTRFNDYDGLTTSYYLSYYGSSSLYQFGSEVMLTDGISIRCL